MAQDDQAILVGISRYSDSSLPDLRGPLHDVALMERWLSDVSGGDVPAITTIVSDESAQVPPGASRPPVMEDFLAAFRRAVLSPDGTTVVQRPHARLYLFLAGHGFCERNEVSAQAALYVANCTRMMNFNICGTDYARWARDQGAFGEIVLVMDCCRDGELYKEALPVPFRRASQPVLTSRLLEIYAAPRGGKAHERPIPERDGQVHGLLTHALMKALDHAAAQSEQLTTQDLKGYIHNNWNALCGEQPADRPEILTPPNGEMLFRRPRPKGVRQGFKLTRAPSGAQIEIRAGTDLQLLARIRLEGDTARIVRGEDVSHVPLLGGRLEIELPSTLCLATVSTQTGFENQPFQVGAGDVEL